MTTIEPGEAATLREASEQAAAAAKVAHGGVEHGDNDPEATARLRYWLEGIDRQVPRVVGPDRDRAMCAAWGDHEGSEPWRPVPVPLDDASTSVPWSVRNADDEEVGIIWSGDRTASITTDRPDCRVVRVTDPDEVQRYRTAYEAKGDATTALDEAKRRTRHDVAGVIT